MASWLHKVAIRHLFTDKEDHPSVQASMNAIADVLDGDQWFSGFDTSKFRDIPQGDDVFGPVDYANRLLERMWDYCDRERIWIVHPSIG